MLLRRLYGAVAVTPMKQLGVDGEMGSGSSAEQRTWPLAETSLVELEGTQRAHDELRLAMPT
jgi:hypothetical protein